MICKYNSFDVLEFWQLQKSQLVTYSHDFDGFLKSLLFYANTEISAVLDADL